MSSETPAGRQEHRVEIHIPSEAEFVRVVRLALAGLASRLQFSYDDIEDIKLAVSEACNNAIQHASGPNGAGRVVVECVTAPDRLTVKVRDHGPGIDNSQTTISDHPPQPPEESGLGLYVMKALMDEVTLQGAPGLGTCVQLVKYVKR